MIFIFVRGVETYHQPDPMPSLQRQLSEAHAERGGTSGTGGLGLFSGGGVMMGPGG